MRAPVRDVSMVALLALVAVAGVALAADPALPAGESSGALGTVAALNDRLSTSPWWMALTSVIALSTGGIAAVLGLWVGRDKDRPIYFAFAMTVLIVAAVSVGIVQSVLDADEALKKQADLDRMIGTVTEIAMASGDEELAKLVESHMGTAIVMPPPEPAAAPAGDTAAPGTEGAAAEGDAPSDVQEAGGTAETEE